MRTSAFSKVSEWTGISVPAVEFWLQKVRPTASVQECRAEVIDILDECEGVKTVTLRPNRRWRGFVAGQHVHVSVDVDGTRLQRTWTISSAADARDVTLTIGRIPDGRVTTWVHDRLRVGDIVTLSAPDGAFVLPQDGSPVVFLAGGAGVTPALSMLRTMHARRDMRRFELVHFVRSPEHTIAAETLCTIEQALPYVRVHTIATYDDAPEKTRRIDDALLAELKLGGDPAPAQWMICGPQGFMDAATEILSRTRPDVTPVFEHFSPPSLDRAGEGGTIHLARDGGSAPNGPDDTLLSAIEATGRSPKHGCRAGICFQCTCTKTSGTVLDLRTGKLLDEDGERIQLCVSQAVGEVTLDL